VSLPAAECQLQEWSPGQGESPPALGRWGCQEGAYSKHGGRAVEVQSSRRAMARAAAVAGAVAGAMGRRGRAVVGHRRQAVCMYGRMDGRMYAGAMQCRG
jgi:hypothetical protein